MMGIFFNIAFERIAIIDDIAVIIYVAVNTIFFLVSIVVLVKIRQLLLRIVQRPCHLLSIRGVPWSL